MIASLMMLQTKAITDPPTHATIESMLTRIEALGTVHRRLCQSSNVGRFDVADFARDLHAFPDGRVGRISITVAPDGRHFGIKTADDGVGMPNEVLEKRTFGKRLTGTLARQLNASIAWQANNPGTVVSIRLPREFADRADTK